MQGFGHLPDKYRHEPGMIGSVLKQAIFLSLLGHATLFSMFSLTFGPKIPEVRFARVFFLGGVLRNSDLMASRNPAAGYKGAAFRGKSEILVLKRSSNDELFLSKDYVKPPVSLPFNGEKSTPEPKLAWEEAIPARKEPAIMFYPRLPYHFALYFKDRQTVHIELMFRVISGEKRNSILVKRRISSGNLEADLLSMRYISRYLFIQQKGYAPDKWQAVKIDLSTVND